MKKITLLILLLISNISIGYSQFSENFDSSTTLPTGWSIINNGDPNTWTISTPGTGTANSGTNVARIYYNATAAHDDYLITPQFIVTAGVSDFLTLWAKNRSTTFPEPFDILISTTDNTAAAFTTTIASAVSPSTIWEKYRYDLTAYAGLTVYIAFHSTTTNMWQLYLDDVSVSAAPSCIEPTGLTISSVTTSDATLTWTPSSSNPANGYEYYLSTSNTAPLTTDIATGSVGSGIATFDLLGLTSFTDYYVWVRSICSSSDSSDWSSMVSFKTLAIIPANDDCSNATIINCGDTLIGETTAGATGGSSTSCVGTIGDDIWYSYVGDGQYITLTATSTNGEGPQVEVYESTDGTCSGFTAGSCLASSGSSSTTVTVSFVSTLGKIYYTHIGSWINGDPEVIFDLAVTCSTPPVPPANDDCVNATIIDSLPYSYTQDDASTATNNLGFITTCTNGMNDGLWYSFMGNGSDITITATPTGTSFDPQLGVYSGSCDALICEGTVDVGFSGDLETYTISASVVGTMYYVNIADYSSSTDNPEDVFVLDVTTNLANPTFDNSSFTFYPNPVKDVLNISNAQNISKVQVINLLGQEMMVKTMNENQGQIDMSQLSSGTYLVKVTSEDQVKTIKVIKE